MKFENTTPNETKTFKLTLTKEEAQWLYALTDFPLHDVQPDEAVTVWGQFATTLDEAYGWDLVDAESSGLAAEVSFE